MIIINNFITIRFLLQKISKIMISLKRFTNKQLKTTPQSNSITSHITFSITFKLIKFSLYYFQLPPVQLVYDFRKHLVLSFIFADKIRKEQKQLSRQKTSQRHRKSQFHAPLVRGNFSPFCRRIWLIAFWASHLLPLLSLPPSICSSLRLLSLY